MCHADRERESAKLIHVFRENRIEVDEIFEHVSYAFRDKQDEKKTKDELAVSSVG